MSDPALHDRPVLVLDPGVHTAPIRRADVDRAGRFAVTASEDKTVRVWSLADGALARTIRLPAGPGDVGKAYAVAISPDGAAVAAGGWTRGVLDEEQIYLFDRATGTMTGRFDGLPRVVNGLAFSPDGMRLAAVLGGLRLYTRGDDGHWRDLNADRHYGDATYGVAFAADSRLATTSWDGRLRLYDADGNLLTSVATRHARPYGLAFNPKDGRLAVGFDDSAEVLIYDGATLAELAPPDVSGIDNGNLMSVAWSTDGAVLFAAGQYWEGNGRPVFAWDSGGAGPRRTLPAGGQTVMSLRPQPSGALLAAADDPWLAVLEADGTPRWPPHLPAQIDPRGQMSNLAVSPDGMLVEFGLDYGGESRRCFDVGALKLLPPVGNGRALPPVQDGLAIEGWEDTTAPTLAGAPLPLDRYERARSLAIAPGAGHFLLGADWWLRAFDAQGAELWRRAVPGTVWAVNVAGGGRLAVAAYGDGTIRWHRTDDGAELLALFPLRDGEGWVAWTPEGVYAATPKAKSILRWHVNHGWDAAGEAIPVSKIPKTHRPDVIPHVLPQLGTFGAIAVAGLAEIRDAVQYATGAEVAPGARLHVLAIGVGDHGEKARNLDLAYAGQDARDVAAALRDSQGGLYAKVFVSELVDADATRTAIRSELEALAEAMQPGDGADLAVVLFSGHGEIWRDKLYLIPHGVDAGSSAALIDGALSATDFHDLVAAVARHGRVLLFLDACFAGGATVPLDRSLRAALQAPNVSVFASSSARERSLERMDWENGALTEALLAALREADADHDGLIRVSDLSGFLSERVPGLTADKQHPEVEIHFDRKVLAAMLPG